MHTYLGSLFTTYIDPVSISCVEGVSAWWEKLLQIPQACNLELLRFLLNDFPVEGVHQRCWVEKNGTIREVYVALADGLQVVLCNRCLV